MWTNAQRDGRPDEHRWRPLFNAAVWLTPTTTCRVRHAVTLPRRETRWNLQGCLKLPDRSQPLVGQSSPYCGDMWRTYCCLTGFSLIVDTCLSCKDIAWQSCAMVPRWRFLSTFLRPVHTTTTYNPFNSHLSLVNPSQLDSSWVPLSPVPEDKHGWVEWAFLWKSCPSCHPTISFKGLTGTQSTNSNN